MHSDDRTSSWLLRRKQVCACCTQCLIPSSTLPSSQIFPLELHLTLANQLFRLVQHHPGSVDRALLYPFRQRAHDLLLGGSDTSSPNRPATSTTSDIIFSILPSGYETIPESPRHRAHPRCFRSLNKGFALPLLLLHLPLGLDHVRHYFLVLAELVEGDHEHRGKENVEDKRRQIASHPEFLSRFESVETCSAVHPHARSHAVVKLMDDRKEDPCRNPCPASNQAELVPPSICTPALMPS